MTYGLAALLGVVQGLTEFLPISSTAHLLLGGRLLGHDDPGNAFTVMIQLGSVLALMWLYRARLAALARGLRGDARARRFALAIVVACLPAIVIGTLVSDFVKQVLYDSPGVIAVAFVAGGAVMLAVERNRPMPDLARVEEVPLGRALAVGVVQVLALVPGVSRSGATIVGGLLMRLDRTAAAELSFFLAMPIMTAAFVHDAWEVRGELTPERAGEIAVGFAASFVAALVVVRPFLRLIARSGFGPFAWYRIAAGAAIFVAMAAGWL